MSGSAVYQRRPLDTMIGRLQPASKLTFHSLVVNADDDQYIIGRAGGDNFVVLPSIGIQVIELLQQGYILRETQEYIQEEYDVEFDIADFVSELIRLNFVQAIDEHILETPGAIVPHLPWLDKKHTQWIFSKPVQILYAAYLIVAGVT